MTDEDLGEREAVASAGAPEGPDGDDERPGPIGADCVDGGDGANGAEGSEAANGAEGSQGPEGDGVEPRRRLLTWRRGIAVVVILAALLGLAGVGAERYARHEITSRVLSSLHGLSPDARLSLDGPVLPQVVRGEIDSLSITASTLTVMRAGAPATEAATPAPEPTAEPTPGDGGLLGGLLNIVTGAQGCSAPRVGDPAAIQGAQLSDVALTIEGLSTSGVHHADHVVLSGTLPWAEVDRMAGLVVGGVSSPSSSPLQEGAANSPGTAILRGTVCGQGVGIHLAPVVTEAGGVSLTVTSISWAGRDIPADQSIAGKTVLEWLGMGPSSLGLPADALPTGFRVTAARVGGGGIEVRIEASDADLSALTPS
ncbi:hypothetical protein [Actinomyces marmotae]|uniref:DUF2993 domain-containing protein n=1 Tax=Actinomyces marmotae TaxID=2737173 RepID=A0A6M8B7Z5_9ACTO|nr:hypothetical protein [Actinomyces marmotae]QKD79035.1 hypothetical protein HPC72_01055 [Actinomyces marmotae]